MEATLTFWGSSSARGAELSGLFFHLLFFLKWRAGRGSRVKNTFLIASIPYATVEFVLDINRHPIERNERQASEVKVHAMDVQCVLSSHKTPAPLGALTKQTAAAASSQFQICRVFLPCPFILAQHSSFFCKARKSSEKPRQISIFMFSSVGLSPDIKAFCANFISRTNCNFSSTSRNRTLLFCKVNTAVNSAFNHNKAPSRIFRRASASNSHGRGPLVSLYSH